MKRILISSVFLILLLSLGTVIFSASPKVVDEASLLTDKQLHTLSDKLDSISQQWDMDLVIVSVTSLNGRSAQSYADDLFDFNGYGIGDDRSGTLLLLSIQEHAWAVSTCGGAIKAVTNSEIDEIMTQIAPSLSSGNYYAAFDSFSNLVEQEYASSSGSPIIRMLIALAIGAAIAGITLLILRSKMNTARFQSGASNYMDESTYRLYRCQDLYLYSRTSKVRKAESSSSTHSSSSGRSHGGSSGRF